MNARLYTSCKIKRFERDPVDYETRQRFSNDLQRKELPELGPKDIFRAKQHIKHHQEAHENNITT